MAILGLVVLAVGLGIIWLAQGKDTSLVKPPTIAPVAWPNKRGESLLAAHIVIRKCAAPAAKIRLKRPQRCRFVSSGHIQIVITPVGSSTQAASRSRRVARTNNQGDLRISLAPGRYTITRVSKQKSDTPVSAPALSPSLDPK